MKALIPSFLAVFGAAHPAHPVHHMRHHHVHHVSAPAGDYEHIIIDNKVFRREWKTGTECGLISVNKTTGKVTGYDHQC